MAYSYWRIAVDPANPNNLIVGTKREWAWDQMGLYKTEDNGRSFRRMDQTQSPSELNSTDCACQIVLDPDDPDTLYVVRHGGDEEGKTNWRKGFLYKSDDGGTTWNQLGAGQIEGGRPNLLMLSGGTTSSRELLAAV